MYFEHLVHVTMEQERRTKNHAIVITAQSIQSGLEGSFLKQAMFAPEGKFAPS
jgi:hypothetical protein